MHALRLIKADLAIAGQGDPHARERLIAAAMLCGRGTEQGGTGLASVLAHAIGQRSHAANGIVNAIVLPHTMRFNAAVTANRSATIVDALGGFFAERSAMPDASAVVEAFLAALPAPRTLREIGIAREDLGAIAEAAMTDWFITRNARPVTDVRTLVEIIQAAW
jgi:alcohol dehydrogenase class IV